MKMLSEAIDFFLKKDYHKALELFKKAGEVYGDTLVAANILLCEKNISGNYVFNENFELNSRKTTELDPATKFMLASMGQLDLTESEKMETLKRYQSLTARKSEDAEIKTVNPIPADWPKDLVLAKLPDGTNDFIWNKNRRKNHQASHKKTLVGLSIVVPTFNRSKILDITLACLVNQETKYAFEVIVADDGSKEDITNIIRKYESILDIKYVRQKDYGYQLCAVRNFGLRASKYDYVAILDCDMAPNIKWVESYMNLLLEDDDVALIGPRKYIDTSRLSAEEIKGNKYLIENLPEIKTNNNVAGKNQADISVDWRLEHFRATEDLRLCDTPFRYFSGGNVAFARKWLDRAGWFDEEFTHWGGEDNEFGYRLYREGCFFRVVWGAMAYHQEPPGKENETDRAEGKKITINIVKEKVPYYYRKPSPLNGSLIHKRPLVSIYIPAYNCADHIVRCVDSALNQTIVDLEVCICNDGSTDNTLEVLKRNYSDNPRVRYISRENGGIGAASNAAVKMARGYYIGQLDSDDYLEPDAVEICLKEFFADRRLACVYTSNRNVRPDGELIANGYNWSLFSREKLTTAMIVHHFRMFTARAWNLTSGFDQSIKNAVDYDIYLKLSEVGPFKHVNKISYNRVLHGENTSIKNLDVQKLNHFKAVNKSLGRQSIYNIVYKELTNHPECRKYKFEVVENA